MVSERRRSLRRVAALLALGLGLVATTPALAAPTAAERETARRLMDEGKERTRTGDLERALDAYEKAHELMGVPTTGVAVARTLEALGRLVRARDAALEVVRMPKEGGAEPRAFVLARQEAQDLEADLKERIPSLRIVVRGGPATRIRIDDDEVAALLVGEPVAVDPGPHEVTAYNADGAEANAAVTAVEGEEASVVLALPATSGREEPGGDDVERARTGGGGARGALASGLVYGGLGLAAAGLVAGGVTGGLALGATAGLQDQCDRGICAPSAAADLDAANGFATIATVSFAVAGAGALIGAVGLLLKPSGAAASAEARTGPRPVAVWIGPTGLGVGGAF